MRDIGVLGHVWSVQSFFSLLSKGFEQERPEICVNRRCLNEEVRGRRVVKDVGVVRDVGVARGKRRCVMVKMSEELAYFLFCRLGANSQRTAAALPK